MSLTARSWLALFRTAAFMALALFLPAGTLDYWQAWAFGGACFATWTPSTLWFLRRDPALLERRLKGGPLAEKQIQQKLIMLWISFDFAALLVVPGLDRRFGWSVVPAWVSIAGDALAATGFFVAFLVCKENTFSAATVEIAPDHRVISTGPYAIVRHPMYTSGLLSLLAMSPALGSWWGLIAFAAIVPAIVWRLLAEEALLKRDLPGYVQYCETVRWRLIPLLF